MHHPIATIEMENGKHIIIELYPEEAPNTVNSFIYLANHGCFDNHAIERIVPGYVVDASYRAFGKDMCKYLIANESTSHGYPNHIKIQPGVIAMGGYENGIAAGEFFFPLAENPKLDGNYPGFGIIKEGLEEVLSWEKVPLVPVTHTLGPSIEINCPADPIRIKKVRVDTLGRTYPDPIPLENATLPDNWK